MKLRKPSMFPRSNVLMLIAAAGVIVPLGLAALSGCGSSGDLAPIPPGGGSNGRGLPSGPATTNQVTRGRYIVTTAGCADCHNRGKNDPSDPNWLAGFIGPAGGQGPGAFDIGPFKTYAANLTPDTNTGLGTVSDRQVFNALRFGLDPKETPDVTITSTTPGQGNFPAQPHYLAPPMPWPATRHFSDDDAWAVVAYLKHGIKAVSNTPPESGGPPDHWASSYTDAAVGPADFPPYPAGNEQFNP